MLSMPLSAMSGPPMRLSDLIVCLILLAFGAVLTFGLHLHSGYRQFRDGRGRIVRYLLVSGAITLLSLLPAAAGTILAVAAWPRDQLVIAGLLTTALCVAALTRFLHPPGYWKLTGKSLDEVRDDAFLQRVRALAEKVGLRTPVVRLLPSMGGDMIAHAAAGGLPAPSLVVSDGILHRLLPAERDAVVAHELAHIRNASLWMLACTAPLSGIAALLVTSTFSTGTAILFGIAVYVGLYRAVSRQLEFDCDRRAGEANGFATTFSALAKVHAILPLHNTGLRSLLLYATATHPSRDERLAALARRMVEPPPESEEWSPRAAARRRLASWIAAALWLSLLVASLLIGQADPDSWWPSIIVIALIIAPFTFQVWALRPEFKLDARRRQSSGRMSAGWGTWLTFGATLVLSFLYFQFNDEFDILLHDHFPQSTAVLGTLLAFFIGVLVFIFKRWGGISRLELEIATALQQHDWQRALDIGSRRPRTVRRSAAARHNLAIAKLKLGRWDEAVADLEQLRVDEKGLKQTWVTLALMAFDEKRAERALELARELQRDSKRDPSGWLLASRALRELGRLDEAAAELETARRITPEDGAVLAGETMLRISRGDLQEARLALTELERRSPGDTILPFIEAELAFAAGNLEAARTHIGRAADIVRVNPFTLMEGRLARLQERLANADPAVSLDIVDWIADDPPAASVPAQA